MCEDRKGNGFTSSRQRMTAPGQGHRGGKCIAPWCLQMELVKPLACAGLPFVCCNRNMQLQKWHGHRKSEQDGTSLRDARSFVSMR